MRMTIERMHIQNFKGIRDLEIDFGAVTRISGMNGTGKTTIPDAFSWVLFNKDSRGNAPGSYDFHEKPLDGDGNESTTSIPPLSWTAALTASVSTSAGRSAKTG